MIIRIMGEGQYRIDDALLGEIRALDDELDADVERGDDSALREHLESIAALVRGRGTPLPEDEIVPSDATIPPPDITLAELQTLLTEEGLVPG